MQHIGLRLSALSLSSVMSFAFAGTMGPIASEPVNLTGFYAGLGGAYNSTRVETSTSARLSAVSGFPPLGTFRGRTGNYARTQQVFSPEAQIGYFEHIQNSNWLWGLELAYQYSGIEEKASGDARGAHITVSNPNIALSNDIRFSGVKTSVDSVLMMPAILGYSFTNGFVYAGFGPSLFQTKRQVGAASDELSALYIGSAPGYSHTQWMWAGAAQAGAAYYLNPSWFLKLHYTYAETGHYSNRHTTYFNPAVNGGLNTGRVTYNSTQRLVAQELSLSINKVFSL